MAKQRADKRRSGVSAATDELASTLLGNALDLLANGEEVGVLLAVGDASGVVASYAFADDGIEALLAGAREQVHMLARTGGDNDAGLKTPVRWALVFEGAVEPKVDAANDTPTSAPYVDALLLEFGETGYRAYSAYTRYWGKGEGDKFTWAEPAPAGEVEPLL